MHKRRYLLQPIAVELFTTNGQNYLLSFQKQFRNKVYQKFSIMATNILENAALSVSGKDNQFVNFWALAKYSLAPSYPKNLI